MKVPQFIEKEDREKTHHSVYQCASHANIFHVPAYEAFYNNSWQLMPLKEVKEVLHYVPSVVNWIKEKEPEEKKPVVKPKKKR